MHETLNSNLKMKTKSNKNKTKQANKDLYEGKKLSLFNLEFIDLGFLLGKLV